MLDDLKQKVLSALPGKENASRRAFVHDRLKTTRHPPVAGSVSRRVECE
jgi:hypothetical protein